MKNGKGGVMERKATALALHEYFEALDPGNLKEADACTMHYGCACVVVRARQATQMLLDVMRALKIDPATPVAPPAATSAAPNVAPNIAPAVAPAATPATMPALNEVVSAAELAEPNARLDVEHKHVQAAEDRMARLLADNQRLRDHIRLLQRQLERIHERREMSVVLSRLENGDAHADVEHGTRVEAPDAPPTEPGTAATASPEDAAPHAEGPSAPEPSPAGPAKPRAAFARMPPPATLAEVIEMEGAMPVGKDDASAASSATRED